MEQHKKTYVTPATDLIIIGEDLLEGGIGPSGSEGIVSPGAKPHSSWDDENVNVWNESPSSPPSAGSSALPFGNYKSSLWDD